MQSLWIEKSGDQPVLIFRKFLKKRSNIKNRRQLFLITTPDSTSGFKFFQTIPPSPRDNNIVWQSLFF